MMSDWLDYHLCVLATSSKEVQDIAARLNAPSEELRNWMCERLRLSRIDGVTEVAISCSSSAPGWY